MKYGCLIIFIVLLINLTVGSLCFNYDLWAITGKEVPWIIAGICGMISGEVVIPLALILWILSPFFTYPLL